MALHRVDHGDIHAAAVEGIGEVAGTELRYAGAGIPR
jgi:predicted DNA-binding protein with PD1-like motif